MILSFFFFFLKGFWFSLCSDTQIQRPLRPQASQAPRTPPVPTGTIHGGSFLLACPALTTAAHPETQVTCQAGSGQVPPQPRILRSCWEHAVIVRNLGPSVLWDLLCPPALGPRPVPCTLASSTSARGLGVLLHTPGSGGLHVSLSVPQGEDANLARC